MPNWPRVSGEQTIRALERLGFTRARQKGSHVVLKKTLLDDAIGCVVPLHRELATGTLRGILNQAKVSLQEFLDHL
ncbi:MAG: type II toxin-antitoxin system HicA family toxin [Acidobacteria bacterium]|nr:type II toxin-antitoxin system HicA family toxin [Acidobacteriota bacterium]MBI3656725.1 type II toxin-antitoxin system HicA family toxin [Acidobacteriota bacterium]